MRISPPLGCSSPAMARNVVVLPQPEGPSSVNCSPGATEKLTPRTAGTVPYLISRFETSMCDVRAASAIRSIRNSCGRTACHRHHHTDGDCHDCGLDQRHRGG